MQRLVFFTAALLCASASAQTTINITPPGGTPGSCIYTTNAAGISSNAVPGQLQATAVSATPGCGSASSAPTLDIFGPASDLSASPTSLAGGTGIGSTFAFQPLAGAASTCTGMIQTTSGTGSGTFTRGTTLCSSGTTSCSQTTPLSIPATFTNTSTTATSTYAVSVSCTAVSGLNPATQVSKTVTISQAAAGGGGGGGGSSTCLTVPSSTSGITNFSQLTGIRNVSYFGGFNGNPQSVDVTQFSAVYLDTSTGLSAQWPSFSSIADFSLPTSNYISLAFTPPANFFTASNKPANLYGEYSIGESGFSANISMTISTTCGDFSNPSASGSTVVPGCYLNNGASNNFIAWTSSTCQLSGSTPYFLNIVNANIANVSPAAKGSTTAGGTAASTKNSQCVTACSVPINNGPGTWPGYTPH